MDFLGDSNNPSAVDVIAFVREVVEKFPDLRPAITEKLVSTFGEIKSGKVFRGAMWIVGEYCTGGPGTSSLCLGRISSLIIQTSRKLCLRCAKCSARSPSLPQNRCVSTLQRARRFC